MKQNQPIVPKRQPPDALLKQSEERFRQLIKNSFDMIVLIDSDGMQTYVSESCIKILGFQPEDLINIPVIESMIHPDDRDKTLQGLRNIIEKKGIGGAQYRHRHKDGSWVYLEAFGTNQLDNPAVGAVVLNVRDITERKLIEQALQESELRLKELNAAKDKFFSIIAHDLKSPFNSILGFSELLMEQVKERNYEGVEFYVMGINHSARRTLDLLSNLLEWSRAQTGQLKFRPTPIDLVDLVFKIRGLLENIARQKGIVLYCELPLELMVMADKDMVALVLRNLISNGIKFTNSGGYVKISASREGKMVKVIISDNGTGIPPKVVGKLFRMDEHVSTLGTQKEQGTGLGLLLCKEFIEKHGCKIGVESEQGKGSAFWFTLPAASPTGVISKPRNVADN